MIEPDDFGLPGVRTFAHVGDPTPAPDHAPFWNHWHNAVHRDQPVLRDRTLDDPSDPTATHEFESAGGVRIGCALVLPECGAALRAGLVVVHGTGPRECAVEHARWRDLSETGVAVLAVRLRGFPGSQRETGDLRTPDAVGAGWLARGFDAPTHDEWVLPHAVADTVNACRSLREWLVAHGCASPAPVMLFGESLGGGIAVMAASQLAGRRPGFDAIDRVAIALPSLGDWRWRLARPACGSAADIEKTLTRHADRRVELIDRLRLCDAVVHAARMRRPTLAKLAMRDDIVPAPTAGAVFNAIDADPARKWRFLVPYGHIDGGIANARRHALFERCMVDYFQPDRRPIDLLERWEPVLHAGDRAPGEDARANTGPPAMLFEGSVTVDAYVGALTEAYEREGVTLDALPYTEAFDRLCAAAGVEDRREALHSLQRMRKAGRLPKLGRAPDRPPRIDPEHERALGALVVELAGSLGQRDRLPYTEGFDTLAQRFAGETGLSLSNHDLWRLIARLAK